jgi:hypothetical protein
MIMARSPRQAFNELAGLPPRDDPEVSALMEAVTRLSREGADTVIRNLLRAALGHERTGSEGYLTSYAEDTLFTMRIRSDPQCKDAFEDDQPARPARAEDLEDVETVLARHGMT